MTQSTIDIAKEYAGTDDLPESEYHQLLAAERRRVTLDVLADRAGPVDLEDLSAAVAAREADAEDEGEVDERSVERVACTLHHSHLPKMDEVGLVDYDPDETRVEP